MKSDSMSRMIILLLVVVVLNGCSLTKPVKTGEMAYSVKQYNVAIELLEKEFEATNNNNEKARKAYLLGQCNDILQNFGESLSWFDIADQYYNTDESLENLASALKKNERYTDASQLYLQLYKQTKSVDYKRESDFCLEANKLIKKQNFEVSSYSINSEFSDYSPVFYEDGFMVFSSDREGSTGGKTYQTTGNDFSDLYVMNSRGRKVYNFDVVINTDANEGTACFNKSFDEIFFTRCVSEDHQGQYCKIFYSKKFNGYWVEPEPLMFFDDRTNFFHPTLIENDSVLVFSAKPNGSDNYDLYYSERVENGWSEAEIMPSSINSLKDEKFPTAYGDTLFFSSNGHLGFGGLDVYKTHLSKSGRWSIPENVGFPINSGSDDFGLIIDPNFKVDDKVALKGFFTSSRNTISSDDIFSFTIYKEEEIIEEPIEKEEVVAEYNVFLAGRVVEVIHEGGDPNAPIIDRRILKDANVKVTSSDTTMVFRTDGSGRFLTPIDKGENYNLTTRLLGYLTNKNEVDVPPSEELEDDLTINVEIEMDKIVYDKEIVISNIYYDFDKWDIREDAEIPLDSLSVLLELNPQLNIELGSHTDCRGDFDYNQDLSQKRAQSVVDYLQEKGIDNIRLTPIGYGESKLNVECFVCENCSEAEHQVNRRTTFKIVSDKK